MFSAVPMSRLGVAVLERDKRAVLRLLGRLGVLHLVATKAGPDTAPLAPPDRAVELARVDGLLARVDTLCQRFGIETLPEPAGTVPEMTLGQIDGVLRPLEDRAEAILKHQMELRKRWNEVETELEKMRPFLGLGIPFDQLGGSMFLHFAVGTLPAEKLGELQAAVGPNVILAPQAEQEGEVPLVAVTSRRGREALESALKKVGFVHEAFSAYDGETAKIASESGRAEREQLRADLQEADEEVMALAREATAPLAELRKALRMEQEILRAEQHFPRTEATALITGWSPDEEVPHVRDEIQKFTRGLCFFQVPSPHAIPDSEIPVLLKHPRLLRPFAMLVTGYGLPTYRELEPTLLFAVTYVIMFGMMFGDVGHGAVLVALALYLLFRGKSQEIRDGGLLVLVLGLASMVFGVVYGSYFGIPSLHRFCLWGDPLEIAKEKTLWQLGGPVTLMAIAIGLGIAMMSVGLVLNVINRFRHGDILGALLDKFGIAGAVFYAGFLFVLIKLLGVTMKLEAASGIEWWHIVVLLVLPLVGVFLKEPLHFIIASRAAHGAHEGTFGESLITAGIEAFDTVLGFLSNTVSFVRLAAYSMAHGAVLLATFQIAEQLGPSVVGEGVGFFVILLGNGIAILLEGIVAAVQAVRLEYYEFFGKFFTGKGVAFRPFRFSTRNEV